MDRPKPCREKGVVPFSSHSAGTQSASHEIPASKRRELDERALTAGYPQARPFPFRFHTRTFHGRHLGDICVQLATADRLGGERFVDREASGLLTRDQDVPGGGGRAGGEGKGDEKGRVSFLGRLTQNEGLLGSLLVLILLVVASMYTRTLCPRLPPSLPYSFPFSSPLLLPPPFLSALPSPLTLSSLLLTVLGHKIRGR